MRILLLGKNGQLGWELQRSLAPMGELIALGKSGELSVDFFRPYEVAATVRSIAPKIIVNAAAFTAVDQAELNPELAMLVNAVTPGLLAGVAMQLDAWLVHYSTDYVFDGSGRTPWREDDPTAPLNQYGRSKLAGEGRIRTSGCKHLIFRTSWVYAVRGANFAKTMLELAQQRAELNVVNDQFGVPTGAELLADVTAHAIRAAVQRSELAGTYHLVPSGETTWYGYARYLINQARIAGVPIRVADDSINAVPASVFGGDVKRPANSRLDTRKLQSAFNVHLPEWQLGVDRMLSELLYSG